MAIETISTRNSREILKLIEPRRPEDVVLGEMSLSSLGNLLEKLMKMLHGSRGMPRFPDPKLRGLKIRYYEELDENPRLAVYQASMKLEGQPVWDLIVRYHETDELSADFVRVSDVIKATAYKSPSKVGTRKTFLGASGFYHDEIEKRLGENAASDLIHIETLLDHLSSVSSSLDDWVTSGMNMMAFCAECKRTGTITKARLRRILQSGKDLETLKQDLVCEGCRQKTDEDCIMCTFEDWPNGCPYCLGKASNMVRPDPA